MEVGHCTWIKLISFLRVSLMMACHLLLNLKLSEAIEKTGVFCKCLEFTRCEDTIVCSRNDELVEVTLTILDLAIVTLLQTLGSHFN